jgi:hypothetical protein
MRRKDLFRGHWLYATVNQVANALIQISHFQLPPMQLEEIAFLFPGDSAPLKCRRS